MEATSRKTEALKSLGFTGAIVATSGDQDGYLQAIVDTSTQSLTPYVIYAGNTPSFPTNLIIKNNPDLEAIKKAGYSGNLFLLTNQ